MHMGVPIYGVNVKLTFIYMHSPALWESFSCHWEAGNYQIIKVLLRLS